MGKKKQENKFFGPVIVLSIMTVGVMILSLILSLIGFEGQRATVVGGIVEMSLTTVRNIISAEGIKYFFGNAITNFQLLEPLVLIILSLIVVGIFEASGLMKKLALFLKNFSPYLLTLLVVFIGVISSFLGDYSYILLIPFIGSLYKWMDRNPVAGVLTIFLGITLGYGTGLFINYNDYILGQMTELAATVDVDKNYKFNSLSSIYIMVISTGIISWLMAILIKNKIVIKYKDTKMEEEVIVSKKAFRISNIVLFIMIAIFIYMIIPGLPLSGWLLGDGDNYIVRLFGPTSNFNTGFVYIILIIMMIYGGIYGKLSGNITNLSQYDKSLSKGFANIGSLFVVMFFASILIGVLDWTNIGEVLCAKTVNLISVLPLSGLPLIIVFFLAVVVVSLIFPNAIRMWAIASPIIVPLFMRANLTPEFAQFVFSVASSIGRCITPLFIYFIVTLGFINKYSDDNRVWGTLKTILPTVIAMMGIWLFIIIAWYIAGVPLGIGVGATL